MASQVDWDCGRIPASYTNPPYVLPTYMIVRVKEEENPKFVILKTFFVTRSDHDAPSYTKFWKFKVLDNPYLLIRGGETWHENGTPLSSYKYYVERDATDARALGIYSTMVKRTANYLIMPHLATSDPVYEYTFTYPKNCLPPKYIYVSQEKDENECYHFKGGYNMCKFKPEPLPVAQPVVPVAQPVTATVTRTVIKTVSKIPTFVFHAYVNSAIEKNECCPVTLEPLSKETVGCAPCGHLFDNDALKQALRTNGKCPTCRQEAKEEDIQTW